MKTDNAQVGVAAWLYENGGVTLPMLRFTRLESIPKGWTETPLNRPTPAATTQASTAQAERVPEGWDDKIFSAMEKAFDITDRKGRLHEDALVIDDTQVGVEFAIEQLKAMMAANPATATSSTDAQAAAEVRDAVRDAVAQALTGIYYCGRVWEAWNVGTMSQDDFTPAAEIDDVLNEITDAAIGAIRSAGDTGGAQ